MQLTHKRLLGFITLSLLLHIIWFTGQTDYRVYVPEQAASQMAIHLLKQQNPVQAKTVAHSTRAKAAPADHGESTQQENKATATHQQFNTASVVSEIRQKLSQHFVYPVLARRMGWQGRVLLGFQLNSAGGIQQVHIKQSSGYAVLDDSAIAALNKIGTITVQQIEGFIGAWQLEIPVIYRLEG